jgi:predicted nucleotidyltransferase
MTLDGELGRLPELLPVVAERFDVQSPVVFGSYARRRDQAGGDLDVPVTYLLKLWT